MKRLLFFALVVFAAWYGWHHYSELRRLGSHDVDVVNRSGHAIERLRIVAGDQVVVVETLEDGAETHRPLRTTRDGVFSADWSFHGVMGDRQWSGGSFSRGPVLMAYRFEFRDNGGVIWSSDPKPGQETKEPKK